jgi:hypothetical protein
MTETIWFELADCIGHALAKRWLTRRRSSRACPAPEPALAAEILPEGQGLEGGPATPRQETDSTQASERGNWPSSDS